jgi:Tfp pilus assembly protein PilX
VERNRGIALILALLTLSFLTILGSALLTTSTIDIWISDNYKSATQSLYLAEAGIDHAREMLRTSSLTLSELLNVAAGPDHQLSTADDRPLIASFQLIDSFGKGSGSYEVTLRNDTADGASSLTDLNEVVTLVSRGQTGSSQKTIEVTIQKGKFPDTDADPRLKSVGHLESLVRSITNNANERYTGTSLGNVGSPANYRVVEVDGNVDLGPATGYGLLLVRGELNVVGDITWNGLILVIGQGVVTWKAGVSKTINGGFFVARTRAADGSMLIQPTGVTFDITDAAQIRTADRTFPYNPIAVKER